MASPTPERVYLVFTLEVNAQTTQKLLTECAKWSNSGTKEIYLLFASPGGNVAAGIAAYNTLRGLPVRLITHNVGNVDSIANVVFLAGEERVAVPHSTFMFHGVGFDLIGNVRADEPFLAEKLESLNADHKKMAAIIQERANFTDANEIMGLFSAQATKDTNYALVHGIIHRIEHLQIPTGSTTLVFSG